MMAHARFELDDPDRVEMTMTVTMTLAQWKKLREQVKAGGPNSYPASWLERWIYDLTRHAERHFAATAEEGE